MTIDDFYTLILSNQIEKVKEVLHYTDISEYTFFNRDDNILTSLVGRDELEMLKLLLENGANPNYQTYTGYRKKYISYTPLMTAAYCGKLDFVELLLKHGADVTLKDRNNETVLHHAIYKDNKMKFEIIQLLIKHGMNIDTPGYEGRTILYFAILHTKDVKLINQILTLGPNLDYINEEGLTCIEYVMKFSTESETLIQYMYALDKKVGTDMALHIISEYFDNTIPVILLKKFLHSNKRINTGI